MRAHTLDSIAERLERASIPEPNSGCFLWLGFITPAGYGMFRASAFDEMYAHRLAYIVHRGGIPSGMTIDHLCRTRCCINPDHLEVVSLRENILRGRARGGLGTHCRNGHAFDEQNTLVVQRKNGAGRRCRACLRQSAHASYLRRKAAAS